MLKGELKVLAFTRKTIIITGIILYHLFCVRHCSKCFSYMNSFNSKNDHFEKGTIVILNTKPREMSHLKFKSLAQGGVDEI